MEEIMQEPKIDVSMVEIDQEMDLKIQAHLDQVEDTIKCSRGNRKEYKFDGNALPDLIKALDGVKYENIHKFFDLIVEKILCDSKVIPGVEGKEQDIIIYKYAYDDVESWMTSDSYTTFLDLKRYAYEIDDEALKGKIFDVETLIIDTLREYYETLERSVENDIVILYDEQYAMEAQKLVDSLEYYSVQSFDITDADSYNDAELLTAMYNAHLMIRFCENETAGEKEWRTKQFKVQMIDQNRLVMFITDDSSEAAQGLAVSFKEREWENNVNNKVMVAINGAPSKESFIKAIIEREDDIQLMLESNLTSTDHLIDALEKQIEDLEDFYTLYGMDIDCRYDLKNLEEYIVRYSKETEYTKRNINRWLGKMRRDHKSIKDISSNKNPRRFYERYVQLCNLVEAQHEHRDRLLEHFTLEDLQLKLGDVEFDRLKLHSIRRDYQREYKATILAKYMRRFEKRFIECKAIDSINPFDINNHLENYENFEACGITLTKEDELVYFTRHTFSRALIEKQRDQHIINSEIERIQNLSKDIEHSVRDYANPTFDGENLKKHAARLIDAIDKFESHWGFRLVNKENVYGGYKGKKCFAKYVDKNRLEKDIKNAIAKNESEKKRENQYYTLVRERDAARAGAKALLDYSYEYLNKCKETTNWGEKDEYSAKEHFCLLQAATLGDRKAQFELAKKNENNKSIEVAIAYYTMSAENDYLYAQLWLGDHYYNKDREKSIYWYKKAADNKSNRSMRACVLVGCHYLDNDMPLALKYFKIARESCTPVKNSYISVKDNNTGYLVSVPAGAFLRIGNGYYDNKMYDDAVLWLKDINDENAVICCGNSYYKMGKEYYDKAIEKYDLVGIDRLSDPIRVSLGVYLLEKGDPDTAYKYFSSCKSVDASSTVKEKIGDCFFAKKEWIQASEIYKECLDLEDRILLKKKLADALFENEEWNNALKYYLEYETEFLNESLFERIADCYKNIEKGKKACEYYLKCYTACEDVVKLRTIAELFLENNEMDEALECYEISFLRNNGQAIPKEITDYIADKNKWDRLVRWIEEYNCIPDDQSRLCNIGNYYRYMQEEEKAIKYYEEYAENHSIDETNILKLLYTHYENEGNDQMKNLWGLQLAKAYFSNGKTSLAIRYYKSLNIFELPISEQSQIADLFYKNGEIRDAEKIYDNCSKQTKNPDRSGGANKAFSF